MVGHFFAALVFTFSRVRRGPSQSDTLRPLDPKGGQLMRDALEAEQAHAFLRAGEIATSPLSAQQRVPRQTDEVAPLWL